MSSPRGRRLFSFSLRSMFAVLTLACCAVGYYANWIRERREALRRPSVRAYVGAATNYFRTYAPWPLRTVGESGYAEIVLHFDDAERAMRVGEGADRWIDAERILRPDERAELVRIQRLFPESAVVVSFVPRGD